jgi:hypothetical protein
VIRIRSTQVVATIIVATTFFLAAYKENPPDSVAASYENVIPVERPTCRMNIDLSGDLIF